MKNPLLVILLLSTINLSAQNLVRNGDFETLNPNKKSYAACQYTKQLASFNRSVGHWNSFVGMTPDYIVMPSDTSIRCMYPKPHSGNKMLGIINYHPAEDSGYMNDYHEMVQGKLKQPLVPGQYYLVEFWVLESNRIAINHLQTVFNRKANIIPGASNNLGVWFTTSAEYPEINMQNFINTFEIKPQVNSNKIITSPNGEWVKVQFKFKAREAYKAFIIGNFFDDSITETNIKNSNAIEQGNNEAKQFYSKAKRIAYYCIDDVSVTLSDDSPLGESLAETLSSSNNYTFKNVLFESGSPKLKPISTIELDQLIDFLTSTPNKKITIIGHTDSVGSAQTNQTLSQQRAQVVADYLTSRGITIDRVNAEGKGEVEPVASNDSPEGRAMNRRVECILR